jgi:hypothetical protein
MTTTDDKNARQTVEVTLSTLTWELDGKTLKDAAKYLEELDAANPTGAYLDWNVDSGTSNYVLHIMARRPETDVEWEARLEKEEAGRKARVQIELRQFAELQAKYGK